MSLLIEAIEEYHDVFRFPDGFWCEQSKACEGHPFARHAQIEIEKLAATYASNMRFYASACPPKKYAERLETIRKTAGKLRNLLLEGDNISSDLNLAHEFGFNIYTHLQSDGRAIADTDDDASYSLKEISQALGAQRVKANPQLRTPIIVNKALSLANEAGDNPQTHPALYAFELIGAMDSLIDNVDSILKDAASKDEITRQHQKDEALRSNAEGAPEDLYSKVFFSELHDIYAQFSGVGEINAGFRSFLRRILKLVGDHLEKLFGASSPKQFSTLSDDSIRIAIATHRKNGGERLYVHPRLLYSLLLGRRELMGLRCAKRRVWKFRNDTGMSESHTQKNMKLWARQLRRLPCCRKDSQSFKTHKISVKKHVARITCVADSVPKGGYDPFGGDSVRYVGVLL